MKRIYLLVLLAMAGQAGIAQQKLFSQLQSFDMRNASAKEAAIYAQYQKNPFVTGVSFISVNLDALRANQLVLAADNKTMVVKRTAMESHDDGNGVSWFGRLEDETGVFFTVVNGQLASKFYMGNIPCLIVPFKGDIHLLITYSNEIDNGICGNALAKKAAPHAWANRAASNIDCPGVYGPFITPPDSACNMRVLLAVTAQAESEIDMPLELVARMLQDESNLAYTLSLINYRMEIARVVRTNYVQIPGTISTPVNIYGVPSQPETDLYNLQQGNGLLSNIATLRNLYSADVVVMVRSSSAGQTPNGTLFGEAFGVPTDGFSLGLSPCNAFAVISTQYMIGGRFTFAHEIGHIQGARHDDDNRSPVYARGYVVSPIGNGIRTIMATGNVTPCSIPNNGCRVQFFSTPSVSFLGVPLGIANERDNARRINETGNQIKMHRFTNFELLLPPETFDNEILARHLASKSISTNNSLVAALSGSRVSMRAGGSVTLLPGFRADNGSVFSAYINSCGYVPTTDRIQSNGANEPTKPLINSAVNNDGFLSVVPNPTKGTLTVQMPADFAGGTLEIFELKGKRLQQNTIVKGTGQFSVNLGTFPAGLYLIRIIDRKGGIYNQKIVKE